MSSDARIPAMEHRRKRVRKGTRSCWECKRRKIKCTYQSEDHAICAGCLDKGTKCLSQEYVDDQSLPDAGNSALSQRMERVEMLLEKVMEKVSQIQEGDHAPYTTADALTPSPTTPLMSLLDSVGGKPAEASMSTQGSQFATVSILNTIASASETSSNETTKKLRRQLAAMLPCQEDVDYLSESSHGWWLIQQHMMPHLLGIPEQDLRRRLEVSDVSNGHPMLIARLLLCVALCIQQLPPNIDTRRLQIKVPLSDTMKKIITLITTTVTADDELTGSVEGVECLTLQAIYHVNDGSLRRSWLAFRRAINVAQLIGIHRNSLGTQDLREKRHIYLWYQIMQGERYLSLVLGIPSATTSASFSFDEHAPWLSTEDIYHRHLCHISGLILARNQGDSTHSFSTTQEIDERLDSLAKSMPQTWWEMPTGAVAVRTQEASTQFERLMCQIWHFELSTLVHLPFMLRAAVDRRYEYSRISCLSASRALIKRWMVTREIHGLSLFSNLTEFQAFTATITLLLGLLGPAHSTVDPGIMKERHEDLELVETAVQTLERLKQRGTGVHMVNQSISVIRTLQGVLRNGPNSSGNLCLEIPHFGTIIIAHSGTVQSIEGERVLGATSGSSVPSLGARPPLLASQSKPRSETGTGPGWNLDATSRSQDHQSINDDGENMNGNDAWMNEMNDTILQFKSSQFPSFEAPTLNHDAEWSLQDSDTFLFDSLINADVEGNWDF